MFFDTFEAAVEYANQETAETNWGFCVCEWLSSQVFKNAPIKYVVYTGWEDFAIYCTINHTWLPKRELE